MAHALSGRQKTSLLKGFAIIAVMVNHYVNRYLTTDFAGYANGVISLFFVLSGYGLAFSLAAMDVLHRPAIMTFYRKRLLRLYPLFWLALLVAALFGGKTYSLATILAFPLHQASGIYWFISSLMQCYVLAPFLYRLLLAKGLRTYLHIVLLGASSLQILFFISPLPFDNDYFVYRDFFLGHLLLFALGLCLPQIMSAHHGRTVLDHLLLGAAVLFFAGSVWGTRPQDTVAIQDALLIAPFFIIASGLVVYATLRAELVVPGHALLILIGDHSYSLYLFHLFYYGLLAHIGLIEQGRLASVLITLALAPLLLLFCIIVERQVQRLASHLQQRWPAKEVLP